VDDIAKVNFDLKDS